MIKISEQVIVFKIETQDILIKQLQVIATLDFFLAHSSGLSSGINKLLYKLV
jgi:hypothetical protein